MANRDTSRSGINKPGLLTLTIKDKSALYMAYMAFVRNGGLFIPTNSNYRLGDEVFMLLNLMGEDEKLPVAGRVIWVTPKGAQGDDGQQNTNGESGYIAVGHQQAGPAHAHHQGQERAVHGLHALRPQRGPVHPHQQQLPAGR